MPLRQLPAAVAGPSRQPPLEQPPFGVVIDKRQCPAEGVAGLVRAPETVRSSPLVECR